MTELDRTLPPVLAALHRLEFDFRDGDGIDFEAYEAFLSAAETRSWLRAWTGDPAVDGADLRVFGQDGTGGYAAFWLVRPGVELLAQPIVFFGSEGELGVVAADFADYLWLLAGGVGPSEAVGDRAGPREADAAFSEFAAEHAGGRRRSVHEVLARARAEFPDFEAQIRALCR